MRTVEELRAIISARTGGQYAGAGCSQHTETTTPTVAHNRTSDVEAQTADRSTVSVRPIPERTPERTRGNSRESKALDRIENCLGRVVAFDGRLCVWTTRDNDRSRDSYDIRDIARRTDLLVEQVIDALPDFTPVKRGKMGLQDAVEESE